MAIQINTSAVLTAAERICALNKTIHEGIAEVDAAVQSLQHCWGGEAAETGIGKYDYLKRNFEAERFSLVDRVVYFMKKQAGESYEAVEQAVASAASAFK